MAREGSTITVCAACDADTALVILPPRYVCAACRQTGTVAPGGNVQDEVPDAEALSLFDQLHDVSPLVAEFSALSKVHRLRPRAVP